MNLKELRYKISSQENLSGKLEKINGAGHKTNRMLGTQNTRLASFKKNISSAASELPFLSRGMGLLSNPITLTTGALGGFVMMLNKGKNEAAAFNTEFRDLYNLNLDKTPFGLAKMRSDVIGSAGSGGFDALRTSQAYYDVQSIANIQGFSAGKMIEKAGSFAQVMRSDFNKTISGTAQVMDIYGISVNKVDDYLSSMYKTVMVGKTTFDEMSKVQVEYASAAAAAGQDYNAANKVFAAFSKSQMSVNIAATMTKTAFQDLTKKSTLDGLNSIGVEVFDINKKMLGVDVILKNLIPKLKGMNDLEFAQLQEKIGGSEGIKGLLSLSKSKADELIKSFNQFDSSEMNFNKALTNAKEDINFINDQINNKLKVSWITLGDTVMPIWVDMKQTILSTVDELNDKLYSLQRSYYRFTDTDKYRELGGIRAEQMVDKGKFNLKDAVSDDVQNLMKDFSSGNKDSLRNKLENLTANYIFPHIENETSSDRANRLAGRNEMKFKINRALNGDTAEGLRTLVCLKNSYKEPFEY